MLCAVLSAWLWAGACPEPRHALLEPYEEAFVLRPQVDVAVDLANDVLGGADRPFILRSSWQETVPHAGDETVLTVHLVRSPASGEALAARADRVRHALDVIWSDDSGITIDEALDDCGELDDCVERLYPDASVDLILEVLNNINAGELGKADLSCNCIILIEQDLQLQQQVFSANWDAYILTHRYETQKDFKEALDAGLIASAFLDNEGLPLEALLGFILLHEVGHHAVVEPTALPGRAGAFAAGLNPAKREELAADAFVAETLLARCFTVPRPDLLEPLCLTSATMGMLTFVTGMKAKSKEARCRRFLDPSSTHPNWQLRFGLIDMRFSPESAGARELFEGYLDIREGLLALDWPYTEPGCVGFIARTLDGE